MREIISRLMDGELEGTEAETALRELVKPEAMSTWICYHVIRDTMQRQGVPIAGFSRRFSARLGAEPTVVAPKRREAPRLPFVWAVAASAAAVLVVGWVTISTLDPQVLVKAREARDVRTAQASSPAVSPDLLYAHQEYSPTMQIQGVGPGLRAVSGKGD